MKLDPPAVSDPSAAPTKTPSSTTEEPESDGSDAHPAGQTVADVPLAPEGAKPVAGEIVQDGLVYRVLSDGESAAWVGWRAPSLEGDVAVPARVASGADSYAVTAVGEADAAEGVLAGSAASSISLPESVEAISDSAFSGCSSLARISVSSKNETFASFDGMLFSKDLTSLLSIPEGKEGVARIPDQTNAVPALAFSHCVGLSCILVGEGGASFAARNGVLYTYDEKTLIACPPGAGDALVIPASVEAIADGAFAGCAVASITVLGDVREIAAGAFDEAARAEAVVALPGGEDYEVRRAAWEAAGFSRFAEPARPGDVSAPEAPGGEDGSDAEGGSEESGLAYEVLGDYTLAVSWAGPEGPAGELSIPAAAEVGGVSYRVSAVAPAGFAGCSGLTGVSLPAGLAAVGGRAFEACGLADVWLPASVAYVGPRALAACPSLERVVALGSPDAAPDALAEDAGVSVYCPSGSEDSWNMGLPAAGNHLMPYGIALADEPLRLEAGRSASLLDGGSLLAPEPVEASYSYAAKPLSVDADGLATGKAEGASEVAVSLTLDAVELARATRAVEVTAAPDASNATSDSLDADHDESDSAPQISQAEPLALSAPDPIAEGENGDEGERIGHLALLSSGISFEQEVASGHTLKFEVLTEDEATKTGTVSVAKSDDATRELAGDIVIPSSVSNDGKMYKVTAVADNGFALAWRVTSLSFEGDSSLKTIGSSAFSNMISCRFIEVPDSVTFIGARAFAYNASLRSVRIPDAVETLGIGVFSRDLALESVQLGSGVTSVPSEAFEYCASLAEIRVAGAVDSIDKKAFSHTETESVSVCVAAAEGVASWSAAAATAGYEFKEIVVQSEVCAVTFDAQGGFPARQMVTVEKGSSVGEPGVPGKDGASLAGWYTDPACSENDRWDFASTVSGDMTLYAKWVEEVRDGDLVYRMRADGASLSVAAGDPATLSGDIAIPAFFEFGANGDMLPVREIASCGFSLSLVETVQVPHTVEIIGNDAFRQSSRLRAIEFDTGSALTVIETNAFRECSALAAIAIPASVETFGNCVFEKCSSMASVEFEDGSALRTLSIYGFRDCASLRTVRLPELLSVVDYGAFLGCTSLDRVDLSGIETIGYKAFSGSGLVSVVVPESVTTFEANAFEGCSSLIHADIQARLSAIPDATFRLCKALASVSLPSSVKSFGVSVFHSCPLKTMYANGSLSDANVSATFGAAIKSTATVILPEVSADGTETFETMRDAWKGYGFAHVIASRQVLATENGTEDGRWELMSDGTLRIWCEREGAKIQKLNWGWDAWSENAWGPVRSAVKKVLVEPSADAVDMDCWFAAMPSLVDLSGARILPSATSAFGTFAYGAFSSLPEGFSFEGLTVLRNMFHSCSRLTELPEGLSIPSNATDVQGMFKSCRSLRSIGGVRIPSGGSGVNAHGMLSDTAIETLPDDFTVPDSVSTCAALFEGCTKLSELPTRFRLSSNIVEKGAESVFSGCSSLVGLPAGFVIPSNVTWTYAMFANCTSLASLPDDFKIPAGVNSFARMFEGCTSLLSLPAGFDMPIPAGASWLAGAFAVQGERLPMSYAGSSENVLNKFPWSEANRTLVASPNKPAGAKTVALNVKVAGDTGEGSYWTTAYTDASGMLTEPAYAPSRPGMVFTLWYADAACTQRVDFSQPFAADVTIYGKLAPGSLGGALPCEADSGSAFWTLADDGTLYLRGSGTVENFGWDWNTPSAGTDHWGPYRNLVLRISMAPSVRAEHVRSWFMRMRNLIDIRELVIPIGASDISRLLQECDSLKTLPDGFAIPDGVKQTMAMFENSHSLASLCDGFTVPDSVTNLSGMFVHCTSLSSLPEGFKLSKKADWFIDGVFEDCPSLTSLPESFSFSNVFYTQSVHRVFKCELAEDGSRIPMYYGGSDPSVLMYDWESQNRTLVTDAGDMGDFDMQRVTFKVQSADEDAGFPWETRSTAWTNKQGMLADPGAPQLSGYTFSGWCTDEECLEPFDFATPVPEGADTLYGTWIVAGGVDAKLPLVEGATGDVWWRIAVDGTLSIQGKGDVASLGWGVDTCGAGYWGPYRDRVRSIEMGADVGASDMGAWFAQMPNLVDLSGFSLPDNVKSAPDLFQTCTSLKRLPDGFHLPEGITMAMGMFAECSSLEDVPESFVLTPNVVYANWMFNNCSSLRALPSGFAIPKTTKYLNYMFRNCSSLAALPEGFGFENPSNVENIEFMFNGCTKLASIPSSFKTSGLSDKAKSTMGSSFKVPGGVPLETYYAGDPADLEGPGASYWASQNRTLITVAPAGKAFVDLMVPNVGTGAYELWMRQVADVGGTIAEPSAAAREGSAFVSWCTDDTLAFPYDFAASTVPGEGLTLYARYQASSGKLPTTDGSFNASWSLSDGTLRITCVEGATIADLGWTSEKESGSYFTNGHWGPLRANVKRAVMDPWLKAESVAFWFNEMVNLTDADETFVPEGASSAQALFNNCASLASLPADLVIPEGVVCTTSMVRLCPNLTKLPDGFRLPESVTEAAGMFEGSGIRALPQGFTITKNLVDARWMFQDCRNIEQLPDGFSLPQDGKLELCTNMFSSMFALKRLPEGFTVPNTVRNCTHMFNSCKALSMLPDGFALPDRDDVIVAGMFRSTLSLKVLPASLNMKKLLDAGWDPMAAGNDEMFLVYSNQSADYVPVVYLGEAENIPPADWWLKQRRILYTPNDPIAPTPLPDGVRTVKFVVSGSGADSWVDYMTVLADESGKVDDPGSLSRFGYSFEGWYADDRCTVPFDFEATTVTDDDTVVYGKFGDPILRFEVPVSAKVVVDAAGEITPALVEFKSSTPVPVTLNGVEGFLTSGASRLFPNEAERASVGLRLSADGVTFPLPLNGTKKKLLFDLDSATAANPGTLAASISLDLNGAQIDYQPGDDITSFAKLTWTVEAVAP